MYRSATYNYTIRRLTNISYSDGTSENFTYDPLGRRTGMSNANVSLTYGYDSLNRLTSVTNSTYNLSVTYAYDETGNRKQLLTRTSNTVLNQNDYTYDAKNRLVQLTNSRLGAFRFAYDPMDRRTSLQYPNGITSSYAYDKAYRLSAIVSKNSSNQILDAWSYQYDAVGNRTTKTDMDGNIETYGYDNVYRLTDAHYSGGTREAFTYDPVGNRLSQLTETGQTLTYSYDIANQLLTAGSDTFTYDANCNTKTKTTSAGTTNFIRHQEPDDRDLRPGRQRDQHLRPRQHSRADEQLVPHRRRETPLRPRRQPRHHLRRRFVRIRARLRPGTDELLGEWKGENSRRYYTHDALGSITSATDETGAVRYKRTYRPFGAMTSTAASNEALNSRFGFTGREISIGSTMQYRARQYDGAYGRFLQQDSFEGMTRRPPSLHRYIYSIDNPVRYSDSKGNSAVDITADEIRVLNPAIFIAFLEFLLQLVVFVGEAIISALVALAGALTMAVPAALATAILSILAILAVVTITLAIIAMIEDIEAFAAEMETEEALGNSGNRDLCVIVCETLFKDPLRVFLCKLWCEGRFPPLAM